MDNKKRKSNDKQFWAPGSFCRRQRLKSVVTMVMATLMIGFGVQPPAQAANFRFKAADILLQPGEVGASWFDQSVWKRNNFTSTWNRLPDQRDVVNIAGDGNFAYIQGGPLVRARQVNVGWDVRNVGEFAGYEPATLIMDNARLITSGRNDSFRIGSTRSISGGRRFYQHGTVVVNNTSVNTGRVGMGWGGVQNADDVPLWVSPARQFITNNDDIDIYTSVFGDNFPAIDPFDPNSGEIALPSNQLIIQGGTSLGRFDTNLFPYATEYDRSLVTQINNLPDAVSNGAGNQNVIAPFGPYIPQAASKVQTSAGMYVGEHGKGSGLIVLGAPVDELPDATFPLDAPGNDINFPLTGVSANAINTKEDYHKLRFYSMIDHRGNHFRLGQNGVGVMVMNSGMLSMRSGHIMLGVGGNARSRGFFIMNNGYIRTNNGQLRVGNNGNGTFIMHGGRIDLDHDLRIGNGGGAHGENRLIVNDGMIQIGLQNNNSQPDQNRDLVVGQTRGQTGSRGSLPGPLRNQWPKHIFELNGGNVQVSRHLRVARNNNTNAEWNANGGTIFVRQNLIIGNNGTNTQNVTGNNGGFLGDRKAKGVVNFSGTNLVLGTHNAYGTFPGDVASPHDGDLNENYSSNGAGNLQIFESGVLNIVNNASGSIRRGDNGIVQPNGYIRVGHDVNRGMVIYNDDSSGTNDVVNQNADFRVKTLMFGVDDDNSSLVRRTQRGAGSFQSPLVEATNLVFGDDDGSVQYNLRSGELNVRSQIFQGSNGGNILNVQPASITSQVSLNRGAQAADLDDVPSNVTAGITTLNINNVGYNPLITSHKPVIMGFEIGFNDGLVPSNTPWKAESINFTGAIGSAQYDLTQSKSFVDGNFSDLTRTTLNILTDSEWTYDGGAAGSVAGPNEATWDKNNPVGFVVDNGYIIPILESDNAIVGIENLTFAAPTAGGLTTPEEWDKIVSADEKTVSLEYDGFGFRSGATAALLTNDGPRDLFGNLIDDNITITRKRITAASGNLPVVAGDQVEEAQLFDQLAHFGLLVSGSKGSHVTSLTIEDGITLNIGEFVGADPATQVPVDGETANMIIAGLDTTRAPAFHTASINGSSGYEGRVEHVGGLVDISGDLVFGFETEQVQYEGEGGQYRLRGGTLRIRGSILHHLTDALGADPSVGNNDYYSTLWINGGKLEMTGDSTDYGHTIDIHQPTSSSALPNEAGSIVLTNLWIGGDQNFGNGATSGVTNIHAIGAIRPGFSNGNHEYRLANVDTDTTPLVEGEIWHLEVNGYQASHAIQANDTQTTVAVSLYNKLLALNIPGVLVEYNVDDNDPDTDPFLDRVVLTDTSSNPNGTTNGVLVNFTNDAIIDDGTGTLVRGIVDIDSISGFVKPINVVFDGTSGLNVTADRIHNGNDGRDGRRTVTTFENMNYTAERNNFIAEDSGTLHARFVSTGNNAELTTTNFHNVDLMGSKFLSILQIGNWGGEINIGSKDGSAPSFIEVKRILSGTNRTVDIEGVEDVVLTSVININPGSMLNHKEEIILANNNNRIGTMNVAGTYRHRLLGNEVPSDNEANRTFYFANNNGHGIVNVLNGGLIETDSMVVGGNNDGSEGTLNVFAGATINVANASDTIPGKERNLWISGSNRGFVPINEVDVNNDEDPHDENLVDNKGTVNMSGGIINVESSIEMARGNSTLNLSGGVINIGTQINVQQTGLDSFLATGNRIASVQQVENRVTALSLTRRIQDGGLAVVNMTGGEINLNEFDVASGRGTSVFHFQGGEINDVRDWIIEGDKSGNYAATVGHDDTQVDRGLANFIVDFNRDGGNVYSDNNAQLPTGTISAGAMESFSTNNFQIGHDNDTTFAVHSDTVFLVRDNVQIGGSDSRIDGRDLRVGGDGELLPHTGNGELYISRASGSRDGQFNVLGNIVGGSTGSSTITLDAAGTDGIDWAGRGLEDPLAVGTTNPAGINNANFHIRLTAGYDSWNRRNRNVMTDQRTIDGQDVKFTVASGNINVGTVNIGLRAGANGVYTQTQGLIEVGNLHLGDDALASGTFNADVTGGNNGQAVIGSITSGNGTSTVNVSSANGDFLVGAFVQVAEGAGTHSLNTDDNRYEEDLLGLQDYNFVPGNASVQNLNIGVNASTSYTQAGGTTDITGAMNIGNNGNGTYNLVAGTLDLHNSNININNDIGVSAFTFTGGTLANLGNFSDNTNNQGLVQEGGTHILGTATNVVNDYVITDPAAEVIADLNSGAPSLTVGGDLDAGGATLRVAAAEANGVLTQDIIVPINETKSLLIGADDIVIATYGTNLAETEFNLVSEAPAVTLSHDSDNNRYIANVTTSYNTFIANGELNVGNQAVSVGSVSGSGSITGGTALNIATAVSPGDNTAGSLIIEATNLDLGDRLDIDIFGASEFDNLTLTGDGNLDFTDVELFLNFDNGSSIFAPEVGDSFDFLNYNSNVSFINALTFNDSSNPAPAETLVSGNKYNVDIDGEEFKFLFTDTGDTFSIEFIAGLLGDFADTNGNLIPDGLLTSHDIDALSNEINNPTGNADFDIFDDGGNGVVDALDGNFWLSDAVFGTIVGDFDLEFDVDIGDLIEWAQGFGTVDATFTQGDANFDGLVNIADLIAWAQHFGQIGTGPALPALLLGSSSGATAIPEPGSLTLLGLAGLALLRRRRQD